MAKRKSGDEGAETTTNAETTAETTAEATTSELQADEPAQATDDEGVRRGLGAPPPGTEGDPSVKPIEPGESG